MKDGESELPVFSNLALTRIHYWTSDWGSEWRPQTTLATVPLDIAVVAGRSSKGHHPFVIVEDGASAYFIAVAWSGNWRIRINQRDGRLVMAIETDDPQAQIFTAYSATNGITGAMKQLISDFREIDLRGKPLLLIEWNSWWPYEDLDINEETILANAKIAQALGFEVVVQDAGWFGPVEAGSHWHDVRGDWDQRNSLRFPNGLAGLSEQVRNLGIDFGIWLEIEALGKSALLSNQQPDFIATRDGVPLGYVCLGNPTALTWARETALNLLHETRAAWIKIDFNVDPGSGCNRADHGHLPLEGLKTHIKNLYLLLDDLKDLHPDLIIENCSSGGLRWDLGMAQHVDLGFASDLDWPEHSLATFWAASHFFPVEKLLNWVDSQWRTEQTHQKFKAEESPDSELEFALAISLLGGFGMSAKLPEFSTSKRDLVARYISIYKSSFRPRYQDNAIVRHLTPQPQRDELGCRTVAFAVETDSFDPMMLIYQLSGQGRESAVSYSDLAADKKYTVRNLISGEVLIAEHSGTYVFNNHLPDNHSIILSFESH